MQDTTSSGRAQQIRTQTMLKTPGIIFDLDGTLIDSAPAIGESINAMLLKLDREPLRTELVRSFMGDGVEATVQRALRHSGNEEQGEMEVGLDLFIQHHEENGAAGIMKYAGADDVLNRLLDCGFRIGLCTNKIERLTTPLVAHLGWTDLFSAIVCGDTIDVRKPNPRALQLAVERTGGAPSLYVGDTHVDVACAEAAGVPLILVDHGHGTPLDAATHMRAVSLWDVLAIAKKWDAAR